MAQKHYETVVVATGNAHKVTEIQAILATVLPNTRFITILEAGGWDEPDENGSTFEANAFIKARAAHAATGLPAIADDSGLAVDALDGAPGVFSARYAGVHGDDAANNAKLLAEMTHVAAGARLARFVSCVAFVDDDLELCGTGTCEGSIGYEPVGGGGFGYDPLFLPNEAPGRTMAELSADEKNAISHRRHALDALAAQLEQRGV